MRKAIHTTVNVLLWVFMLFALMVTVLALSSQFNADGVPSIAGKSLFTVSSDSMAPTFKTGDMIVGQNLDKEERLHCKEGDVITFFADLDGNGVNELNTHRIVSVNLDADGDAISYVTKGDNNKVNDTDVVTWQNVHSKWTGTRLAGIGGFIAAMRKPVVFFLLVVLPLAAIFIYEIVTVVLMFAGKRKKQDLLSDDEKEQIKQKAIEEYLKQQADNTPAPNEQATPASQDADEKA